MLKDTALRVTPGSALKVYQFLKKKIAHRDVHVRLDAVSVRHVARYALANDVIAGRSVLDAACGGGYGGYVLHKAAEYTGLDLDGQALREARRLFPGLRFLKGSVFDLPCENASIGAVVTFETLEHIRQPERAMAEFARVLSPGGVLIGSIPINHPDRIYHVRPYSATEAYEIFTSDERLKVTDVLLQTGAFQFEPIEDSPARLAAIDGGTLLVSLKSSP
ncbi:class I SAM-dependent methyltransferase [Streptomyces sp. NPDC002078]